MLSELRQQSRSFIIWFLFGIIILSFIVTFGPASMRLSCGGATKAGTLAGEEISNADMQFALRLGMPRQAPPTYRLKIYDLLLRREILAQEGKRMGFRVTEDEVEAMITKRRRIVVLGMTWDLAHTGAWPVQRIAGQKPVPAPNYYHPRFKKWVNYTLGMKVKEFLAQQKKELLARRAVEAIRSGVIVSDREARAVYELQTDSLKLAYARFEVDKFRKGLIVSRGEVMRWLSQKENRDAVDKEYKKVKWKLTGLPHERRIRHILVKLSPKASDADKAAARKKLDTLRSKLAKAPTDFARMAQLLSEDEATRASGGDLGWREKSKLGFGKAFANAVFALKPMTVSQVIASDKGFHLVLVEGDRKGDVSLEQARVWLAEQKIVATRALVAARKVAKEALRRLLMGKPISEVFPKPAAPGGAGDAAASSSEGSSSGGKDKEDKKASPPKPWHPLLPQAEEVSVLRTDTTIGPIGKVKGLFAKVWRLTDKSPVLPEVVRVPGSGTSLGALVVIRLKMRLEPTDDGFKAAREEIVEDLLRTKREDAVARWVFRRCEALRAAGQIHIMPRFSSVTYYQGEGDNKKKVKAKYVPCQQLPRVGRAAAALPFR